MKFRLTFLLLLCFASQSLGSWPAYFPSHPEIAFEPAMKAARKSLGEQGNQFYCVGMHWFGIPEYPGKGYWGFSFWNRQKQFRWINVSSDGSAHWRREEKRRDWDYVSPSPLALEDAVAIAQRFLGPQKDLFLSGAGLDSKTYFRIHFYAIGAKDYTNLYVTFDGKVYRNEHEVPGVRQ